MEWVQANPLQNVASSVESLLSIHTDDPNQDEWRRRYPAYTLKTYVALPKAANRVLLHRNRVGAALL